MLVLWPITELLREDGGVVYKIEKLFWESEGEGIEEQGEASLTSLVEKGLVISKVESGVSLEDGLVIS